MHFILGINGVYTCTVIWGGVLHQIFSNRVQHKIKNWIQLDLRFCKNEGLKISKINEKMGQLDQKSSRQIDTKCLKTVKYTLIVN